MRNLRTLSHHELKQDEWKYLEKIGAVNGCGAENRGGLQKMILRFLTPVFFEASCKIHDFGYWKGGDEARRLECDKKFLEAILRDVERYCNGYFEPPPCHSEPVEESQKRSFDCIRFAHSAQDDGRESVQGDKVGCSKGLRWWYTLLAHLFYFAVRVGGGKYFTYK